MAVETDGSRFAAGAWETLKRGISSLGVRIPAHWARSLAMSPPAAPSRRLACAPWRGASTSTIS